MALTINTNMSALQAQSSLNQASKALQQNQERLSTGLRINSAADDAAGLSISKRMTAQIKGMDQAVMNANQGMNMLQTAEGGLDEMTNIMQRMRELAVQASDDSTTASDRADLNAEYQEKLAELDRIAEATEYNSQKLLNGTLGETTFQVGANTGSENKLSIDLSESMETKNIGQTKEYGGDMELKDGCGAAAIGDGTMAINGQKLNVSQHVTQEYQADMDAHLINKGHNQTSAYALAQEINSRDDINANATAKNSFTSPNTGVKAKITASASATAAGTDTATAKGTGQYTLRINNFNVLKTEVTNSVTAQVKNGDSTTITATVSIGNETIVGAVNNMSETLGVTAQTTDQGGKIKLNNLDGGNIKLTERAGTATTTANVFESGGSAANTDGAGRTNTPLAVFNNTSLQAGTTLVTTGGTAAITGTMYDSNATGILQGAGDGAATVVRGTLQLSADSAFTMADLNTNGAGTTVGTTNVTTALATGTIAGTTDFTRNINTTNTGNYETIGGNTTGAKIYNFENPGQQSSYLESTSVSTVDKAQKAINRLDSALNDINSQRANLGANMNRMQNSINNLNNSVENLTSARSTIQDADIAKESSEMTQNNIRRQAASSILAQANQNPQVALQLLGG